MRTKIIVAAVIAVMAMVITAALLPDAKPARDDGVSLTFMRYSELLDPPVGYAAFLMLTNTSSHTYCLQMTGGTNTLIRGFSQGVPSQSLLVNCAFHDEINGGWQDWRQTPPPFQRYVTLGPTSGMVIRVPLSADGSKRKVAALYQGPIAPPSAFWMSRTGAKLLAVMPHWLRQRVIPAPDRHEAWCEVELSYPAENVIFRRSASS